MAVEQLRSLQPALAALLLPFRACFKRHATFAHCQRYILGLLTDLKRKRIEPIALAAGVAVRTLQEFLQFYAWDHQRVNDTLQRLVADQHGSHETIGVIDITAHAKSGDKTPGVQRQWCGETGKVDNCVLDVHLLYTDNHPTNPFSCMLDSALFLPEVWSQDRARCEAAGISENMLHRPRAKIAAAQVKHALGNGVRLDWLTFDEEFGSNARFWFDLDELGQRAKQEAGFGAFEVRTYTSLIRHWLCSRLAMYFLTAETTRLRGENPQITLEQVVDAVNLLIAPAWRHW